MVLNPEEVDLRQSVGRADDQYAAGAALVQASLWRDAYRRFTHNKAAVVSMVGFVILLLYVMIVPWVSPFDPNAVDFSLAYQTPNVHHFFGTDEFGRDLFVRTALGGRISIGIGFAATVAIMVVGILYGAISGFIGGWLDNLMMRILDALYGLAVSPVRDHHAGDLRRRQLLDHGYRADRRVMVHHCAHHARPDHHAQGERLRPSLRMQSERAGTGSSSGTCCRTRSVWPSSSSSSNFLASCSARRSCRSSASGSIRRTHPGAHWPKTATTSTFHTRTSS